MSNITSTPRPTGPTPDGQERASEQAFHFRPVDLRGEAVLPTLNDWRDAETEASKGNPHILQILKAGIPGAKTE